MILEALNKLKKVLLRRKMKNLLLTVALFMQKQDSDYWSGYISHVLQNLKTRRPRRYCLINYEQRWFEKMIARKDEQFSRSFGRMNLECFHPRLTSLSI